MAKKYIEPETSDDFKTAVDIYNKLNKLLYYARLSPDGHVGSIHDYNSLVGTIEYYKKEIKKKKYKDILKQCILISQGLKSNRKNYKSIIVEMQETVVLICAEENEKWNKEFVRINKEAGIIE